MSLTVLLYAYLALIAIFLIFAMIHILHLVYLTVTDAFSYGVTILFLCGFFGIIFLSWIMLADINWNQPLMQNISPPSSSLFQ